MRVEGKGAATFQYIIRFELDFQGYHQYIGRSGMFTSRGRDGSINFRGNILKSMSVKF